MVYPRLEDPMLNQFCLTQGSGFIENSEELIAKWQPVLPALLDQLSVSGVRVVCNHATWMSLQGILIILFYHALPLLLGSSQRRGESEGSRPP